MFKKIVTVGTTFTRLVGSQSRWLSNSMLNTNTSRIVWIDMEMTGLDINTDHIMEVACLVTDSNLNIVAEGPDIVVHQPSKILDNMNEWCTKQHKKTGLTQASQNSTISVQEAEETLFNFVSTHVLQNCSPLAGNSVYMDRIFLQKYMPLVNNYLHYRIIDVSTIKELCRMWQPDVYKCAPSKSFEHRALADIKESVEELKYYRSNFFNLK